MNWTQPLFTHTCGIILAGAVISILGRVFGLLEPGRRAVA